MLHKSRSTPVVPSKSVEEIFDTLAALPPLLRCKECGSELLHLDTTFFSEQGKAWTLPLPVCPNCDGKEEDGEAHSRRGVLSLATGRKPMVASGSKALAVRSR
jgi:hypothetical protein